ncbi:MAG: tripartite tricarboxylate transporter TctB family protein [Proteobacteria bacterium]|nr:tripartite tricarboxylate transporter TctB family protein [Pseudomonadota bacterium]
MATANPDRKGGGARRPAPSLIHRTDLTLAVVVLAICAGLAYQTTRFEEVPALLQQGVPPTWFPRLVLILIGALALMLPFEHIAHRRQGRDIDEDRSRRIEPITFATAGLLVAVVAIMPWAGTLASMALAAVLLPLLWGERRYGAVAAFAVAFPLAVTLLFVGGLKVNFVPGVVGHLFR